MSKDLNNSSKHKSLMDIEIPPNLSSDELKCFKEIVKPQLEELYCYSYNKFEYKNIDIHISKKIQGLSVKEINKIMSKFPDKDLEFVSEIYFVSYDCKENKENYQVNGRTLPIIHKIIIYPKAHDKLDIVLAHETGHIVFEKQLSKHLKQLFALVLLQTFPDFKSNSIEGYALFVKEQFANSYDNFINNFDRLKKFPLIYNFFIKHIN